MPNYRRAFVPGAKYFFTLVTDRRRRLFQQDHARTILGDCMRECREKWPFERLAIVLMPDHLHAIWSLPRDDANYSQRWSWIKKKFTKRWLGEEGNEFSVSEGRSRERRKGVWQPRFGEHTIRDENDFERHFDYIHFNPVKHKLTRCPHEWAHSSFHRWVKAGGYPRNWMCGQLAGSSMNFSDIADTVGE